MNNYKKRAALFLTSQGITLFGSSLTQFAMIWYVTMQTSSGVWVSAMTVAAYLPQFLISFFSGVWADRYSRKKMIILSDALIAVATLLLAVLFPRIPDGTPILLSLVAISVIRSVGTGIQTPAVNAAVPQLVPEDKLMKFNGFNSAIQSLVQFAAPMAAGAVLSFGTLRAAMAIDIATAAVGIGILLAVAIPFEKREDTPSTLSEMKVGIKYAVKECFIGQLLLVFGLFVFLCVPAGFMATLFVKRCYGDAYWYMTLVEVVGFIGMTAGGLIIGAWGGFKNRMKTLVAGIMAFGALAVGMGAIDNFIVYLVLMAFYGVALTMVQTSATTLFQEQSSPEMQGRVFGLFGAMYSGFLPLGMVVFGPLADVVSMRLLMIISGILLLLMSMIILLNRRFYLHKANDREQ
ncbi:MAG: MFS transporter [Eubacteriales bacterium]|nr:MFS transporter [Eubacteriales bacterium]